MHPSMHFFFSVWSVFLCVCIVSMYIFEKHAEKPLVGSALLIQQNNKPQGEPQKVKME